MNTHDTDIELPEYDCLYETFNESGFIDVEPAYRRSTVLRLIEADRKRRGISNDCEPVKRKRPYAQGTALGEFGVIPMCDQVDDEPVNKTDWNAELASWSDEDFVQVFHERPDLANRLRKILAEPVKVLNMTTKSDTERERAEFEAWYLENNDVPHKAIKRKGAGYDWIGTDEAWEIWQAAQAALQSQDREDSERLEWLVENMGFVDIDEGHRGWFVLERDTTNYLVEDCKTFREAIDHARRIEGGNCQSPRPKGRGLWS